MVQAIALSNESTVVDILGRRLVASVLLIKALGGGWNAAELPTAADLAGNDPRQPLHEQ